MSHFIRSNLNNKKGDVSFLLLPFSRYMLLIDGKDENYFFDRDHTVFSAPSFTFPKRKTEGVLSDTLVDGVSLTVRYRFLQKRGNCEWGDAPGGLVPFIPVFFNSKMKE